MYNVLGEICIFILSGIMLFNLFMSFSIYDHIHKLFFFCTLLVFLSSFTNIISIYCILNFGKFPIPVCTAITTFYFIQLGLIPYLFSLYGYNFASEKHRNKRTIYAILTFPFIVYFLFVLLNVKTGLLFYYDAVNGYTRGPFKNITYILSSIYAIGIIIIVLINRNYLTPRVTFVFILYPLMFFLISAIQFFTTYFVMVGTASFAPLLLIYLTIQADLIEYDINTNLLTERFLAHSLSKGYKGKFAVISIDNFNAVQVCLGVEITNALIFDLSKGIARIFNKNAFHLSSNRFAVLSDDIDKVKNLMIAMNSIIEKVKKENDSRCMVNIHIAIVSMPENANSYHAAMCAANRLLLKTRGKDSECIVLCPDNYVTQITRETTILNTLKRELRFDSEQIQVFFRPIYSKKTGKLLYAEALPKLLDTEIGDVPSYEFIQVAENSGLIDNLGILLFEKVCRFISENHGFVNAILINFSALHMKKPSAINDILAVLHRYSLPPSSIIIEMSESIFVDELVLIREKIIELAKNGIMFCLDSFGTSCSNFANIVELPFSIVKFDSIMLPNVEKSNEASRIFISLVNAFKENKLNVLVDGIENASQYELVKQSGADYVQGILFSEPLSPKDFLAIEKKI